MNMILNIFGLTQCIPAEYHFYIPVATPHEFVNMVFTM